MCGLTVGQSDLKTNGSFLNSIHMYKYLVSVHANVRHDPNTNFLEEKCYLSYSEAHYSDPTRET